MSSLLVAASLSASFVPAQCPQGVDAGLVQWNNGVFGTSQPAHDEGLSPVAISLTAGIGGFFFPMPNPSGIGSIFLDEMWINSNGEIYLTDSTASLTQPVGGSSFGTNTLNELSGRVAGGSPRIVVLGGDQRASQVACNIYQVTYETPGTGGPAGQATVTWTDLARSGNTTDNFRFSCTLFANGAVDFSYNASVLPPQAGRWVGISAGNLVVPTAGNLSAAATSLTAALYETFTNGNPFDLSGQTLRIVPSGTGYTVLPTVPYTPVDCAYHCPYGEGCYSYGNNTLYQVFADSATASAALQTTRMTYTFDEVYPLDGYTAVYPSAGGTPFVDPTRVGSTAVALSFVDANGAPDLDDGRTTIAAVAPIPGPANTTSTVWTVSVNGILTAGALPNNGSDFAPTAADIVNATTAPDLGFYTWHDFLLNDTTPNGAIYREAIPGWLYVTWYAVEAYPTGIVNPSTFQYQVDLTTGDVTVVWQNLEAVGTGDWLVGCTLAGPGATPGAVVLDNTFPPTELRSNVLPLTLSAAPRPVQVGTNLTFDYTITNVPEILPGAGTYVTALVLGLTQIGGGGFDLGSIGAPACMLHTMPDLITSTLITVGTEPFTTVTPVPISFTNLPIPPYDFYAQAVALVVPTPYYLPQFGNTAGLLTSNGVKSHVELQ
ncbi:MAG: hypothetical protein JNL08_10570 [Planctomycetes bacterium]|nr:hypothetical protein [Planctomycetota bacterium]